MEHKYTKGYLEIVLGPMFSGKTSKLVEVYKQCRVCDIRVLVVNHADDVRYSQTTLDTHDQAHIPCIHHKTLRSVIDDHIDLFTEATPLVVLINEGQFFEDLYTGVHEMVNVHNAHVYVAGLDGDFKREKFGQMLDLIPLCDQVYKLKSLCMQCKDGTRAIFSHRIDQTNHAQKQVGTTESYVPLCRKCYQTNLEAS